MCSFLGVVKFHLRTCSSKGVIGEVDGEGERERTEEGRREGERGEEGRRER